MFRSMFIASFVIDLWYVVLLFSFILFWLPPLAHTRSRHWRPLRPRPSPPARHRGRRTARQVGQLTRSTSTSSSFRTGM
eukprot:6214471-Pleurochrysis_carterae.AAC.7